MSSEAHRTAQHTDVGVPSGLSARGAAWVRKHADLVVLLPPHGDTWRWSQLSEREDTPDDFSAELSPHKKGFKSYGVIERVGWEHDTEGGFREGLWQTTKDVLPFARAVQEQRPRLPCGHRSGFKTVVAGEKYECGFDYCEETYGRDVIEEVFG